MDKQNNNKRLNIKSNKRFFKKACIPSHPSNQSSHRNGHLITKWHNVIQTIYFLRKLVTYVEMIGPRAENIEIAPIRAWDHSIQIV